DGPGPHHYHKRVRPVCRAGPAHRALQRQSRSVGIKAAEQKDVLLQVGDRARVDFQMQLGAAAETITVEANVVRVQTDSGEVSNVIRGQQMLQIAVNGRGFYELAALTPGASSKITPAKSRLNVGRFPLSRGPHTVGSGSIMRNFNEWVVYVSKVR